MTTKDFTGQMADLIAMQSTTDNFEECRKTVDYIQAKLPKEAKVERWSNNGTEVLLAGNGSLYNPDIAYIVHMDVVAAEPESFKMKIAGDKLLGRGVSDMKYAAPIGIWLLEKVIREKSKVNFTLVISTDEEIGGKNGVDNLATQRGFSPKAVIVPDWGDNFVFTNKSKGVLALRVDSTGKAAHASQIWDGKNANESLCRLAVLLLQKYSKNNQRKTWETTMNIGVLQGGQASNQVCSEASMKLDFRFPETRTAKEILEEVKAIASKIDKSLKLTVLVTALPTNTSLTDPIVKMFLESFKNVTGKKIKSEGGTGATDARHFAGKKIPLLVIKPDGGAVHSSKEWISVKGCMQYFEAISEFLDKYGDSQK